MSFTDQTFFDFMPSALDALLAADPALFADAFATAPATHHPAATAPSFATLPPPAALSFDFEFNTPATLPVVAAAAPVGHHAKLTASELSAAFGLDVLLDDAAVAAAANDLPDLVSSLFAAPAPADDVPTLVPATPIASARASPAPVAMPTYVPAPAPAMPVVTMPTATPAPMLAPVQPMHAFPQAAAGPVYTVVALPPGMVPVAMPGAPMLPVPHAVVPSMPATPAAPAPLAISPVVAQLESTAAASVSAYHQRRLQEQHEELMQAAAAAAAPPAKPSNGLKPIQSASAAAVAGAKPTTGVKRAAVPDPEELEYPAHLIPLDAPIQKKRKVTDDEPEQVVKKREKNTLSARRSRARRAAKMDFLEVRVVDLEAENEALKAELEQLRQVLAMQGGAPSASSA
ncbi:hypothetical protein GGF32_008677 [Allomyces javanicus]|nr:hypothetical protein GGF32_008677 [Allomyces javanicus]